MIVAQSSTRRYLAFDLLNHSSMFHEIFPVYRFVLRRVYEFVASNSPLDRGKKSNIDLW